MPCPVDPAPSPSPDGGSSGGDVYSYDSYMPPSSGTKPAALAIQPRITVQPLPVQSFPTQTFPTQTFPVQRVQQVSDTIPDAVNVPVPLINSRNQPSILDQALALSAQPHVIVQDTSEDTTIHPAGPQPVNAYATIPQFATAPYPSSNPAMDTRKMYGATMTPNPRATYDSEDVASGLKPAPASSSWLDIFLGIAKAAPGGIKTYYDIQTQNQALKSLKPVKAPKVAPMSMQAPRSGSMTPWIIGGVVLLALSAGAVVVTRSRQKTQAKK